MKKNNIIIKMKKHNSNEFQDSSENKHDLNINLWDLDGSSFFLDSNIQDLESTATFNKTGLNCNNLNNINIISYKKKSNDIIFPFNKFPKNKNKSVNSSFVKYNNIPSERKNFPKDDKSKNNINTKNNKTKKNSFCQNYKLNDSMSKDVNKKKNANKSIAYNTKIKKAKQRLNHSVDYSRKEEPNKESQIIYGNNFKLNINIHNGNTNNNKRQNLNKSLSIESLNSKKANNSKIVNSKINYNCNKNYSLANNNKKNKKSNSIDHNIYFDKNNKKNLEINNIKIKKDIKDLKIKENNLKARTNKNKNRSVITKRNIEDAEKYTNNLAKRKIFTHDYELQNKLKKAQEEREAEKEMSQCTFKPQLFNNKYNNRIQSQKINHKNKSLYEKQSQWLNNIKKKKENEREKKMSREIQGCTFIPQLSSLPKYNSKKIKTNREQMDEENYYNKMKKARQIIQDKNKGDDLVERYDERKRKRDMLPRSMLTFGNFNQENVNEGTFRKNLGNINNNINNWKINSYSLNNAFEGDLNINNNITREDILDFDFNKNSENEMSMNVNMNRKINNNYIYNNNINNNYIGLNNNNIFNNNINNNFIIENNNINSMNHINDNLNNMNNMNNTTSSSSNYKNNNFIVQNQRLKANIVNKENDNKKQSLNYKNFINNTNKIIVSDVNTNKFNEVKNRGKINIDSFGNNNILNYGNFFNDSSNKKYNNINKKNNINSNNKYFNQRDNNIYDFDNNLTEEKIISKIQQNNNFINPTLYNDEQEKENANISTSNATKTNSILSLQKKSSHSLPDRPEIIDNNRFIKAFNLNHKINQNQEYIQMNKINNINIVNNANNNTQDVEYNRQKKMLMNELHNWNNFDEESNEDD